MNTKISEVSTDKKTTSLRINQIVYDVCKDNEIPIGIVAEAGLIYFLKLSDDDKIQFLSENLPDLADADDVRKTTKWTDLFSGYLKDPKLPKSSMTSFITSSALLGTAVSIIALLLAANNKE
jgi:hypothetical protein